MSSSGVPTFCGATMRLLIESTSDVSDKQSNNRCITGCLLLGEAHTALDFNIICYCFTHLPPTVGQCVTLYGPLAHGGSLSDVLTFYSPTYEPMTFADPADSEFLPARPCAYVQKNSSQRSPR